MNHTKAAWQRQKIAFALMIGIVVLWLVSGINHPGSIEMRIEVSEPEQLQIN
jgi:hypothetical protein